MALRDRLRSRVAHLRFFVFEFPQSHVGLRELLAYELLNDERRLETLIAPYLKRTGTRV